MGSNRKCKLCVFARQPWGSESRSLLGHRDVGTCEEGSVSQVCGLLWVVRKLLICAGRAGSKLIHNSLRC